jgi:hypothetical protein
MTPPPAARPHYLQAKRLNSAVRALGGHLVGATSQGVYRVTPAALPPSTWAGRAWDWQGLQPTAGLALGAAVIFTPSGIFQ